MWLTRKIDRGSHDTRAESGDSGAGSGEDTELGSEVYTMVQPTSQGPKPEAVVPQQYQCVCMYIHMSLHMYIYIYTDTYV